MKMFFIKIYCRIFQAIFKVAVPLLPWSKPQVLKGKEGNAELARIFVEKKITSVLIVTDAGIAKLGLLENLQNALSAQNIRFTVYDKTPANPTIDSVEEAVALYKQNQCEALVGFGGGSPIDCSKGVAARIARKRKTIQKMKGIFKILARPPLLVAIPTTAGTGSEATCAAVITNSLNHDKFSITDLVLIPKITIHDPALTTGLPPAVTANTGIDALVHAVEAYTNRNGTRETDFYALEALKLIFSNIEKAYSDGANLEARANMQTAAYYAGIAFTRAYVGNIHAIAHTFSGFYGVPHGLANAVILPYILEYYGKSAHKKLARLAETANLPGIDGKSDGEKAGIFIKKIWDLNALLNIPKKIHIEGGLKANDIPVMADRAYKEANPLYPVPKIFSRSEFAKLIATVAE